MFLLTFGYSRGYSGALFGGNTTKTPTQNVMQNPEQTYRIIRFFQDDTPSKVIETGLTRKEAQAHCQDPESEGDGWFDGFQSETDKYTCGCPSSVGYVTEETHPDGTPEETPVCNGCGSEIEL